MLFLSMLIVLALLFTPDAPQPHPSVWLPLKKLSRIWIFVYIGTQNVDLERFGKPPDLHPHIIMDLDLLDIHMHKHTIPNRSYDRSDSHLHAYLHIIYN